MRRMGMMSLVLLGLAGCGYGPMGDLPFMTSLEEAQRAPLHLTQITVRRPDGRQFVPTTFFKLAGHQNGVFDLSVTVMRTGIGQKAVRIWLNREAVDDPAARLQLAKDVALATMEAGVDRTLLKEVIEALEGHPAASIQLESSQMTVYREKALYPSILINLAGRDEKGPLSLEFSRRTLTDFGPIEVQVWVNGKSIATKPEAEQWSARLRDAKLGPAVDRTVVYEALNILDIDFANRVTGGNPNPGGVANR